MILWGREWGSNAPRTVGTLGRGKLSPPITITARAQKMGEGEKSRQKEKLPVPHKLPSRAIIGP